MNSTIGSGDTTALLSGTNTKGFASLLQKFVAFDKPHYNAYASPIDALRTGAILEDRYLFKLSDDNYVQYKVTSKELDCCTASLDFAKLDKGEVVEFEELKTIWLSEFIDVIRPIENEPIEKQQEILKKKFKNNYNQVQFQLFCTGLEKAKLTFLSVETYEDEINKVRDIKDSDVIKFTILRNEEIISKIRKRAILFQTIKDFTKQK